MFFKEFPMPVEPVIPDYYAKITDFGAVENVLCTQSFRDAIAHVAEQGGGHVIVPKGTWKTGAIHLKSNIDLHFEDGAKLDFSTNPDDYLPVVPIVMEGIRCYNYSPFIYGLDLENVSITGNGYLEGNGEAWWPWKKNMTGIMDLYYAGADLRPVEERVYGTVEAGLRSPFIQLYKCKNVLMDGFFMHNSPFWNIDPVRCENIIIRNITIQAPEDVPNTDGINMDSCRRGLMENCTIISVGDDLYCLKSGRNADGRAVGAPCEDIIIRNCRSLEKSRGSGVAIGSEMSGGVRNILVHDCDFAHALNCIRIKSKDGRGGVVENIEYRNLHLGLGMRGINFSFRYGDVNPADDPKEHGVYMPTVRNIYCENFTCDKTKFGIALDGIPNAEMSNLHFKDITMNSLTCITSDSVDGLFMENVRLTQLPPEE